MTELFNRVVELTVGKPGEEGLFFTDIKIAFSIKKDRSSKGNTGEITLFNIGPDTRSKLNDKGLKYEIKAGYAGLANIPLVNTISSGDILEIATQRQGADIVTKLTIGEGVKTLSEAKLDKSYSEGISVKKVIKDLAGTLEVGLGTLKDIASDTLNSGYSSSGKSKDRLDELTSKLGLSWNIQNDELNVYKEGGSTSDTAVVLSSETGLLKAYKTKAQKQGAAAPVDVVKFEALLNPEVKIGRQIKVVSEANDLDTFVTVRSLSFDGDNKDGSFLVKGEAS